mgnify:CR=1 FL=1
MQLRKSRLKFSRLNHIFISHLHGDHCFGLMGLISTFGLLGRTAELHIHSPKGLEELLLPCSISFCHTLAYKVIFHEFDTRQTSVVYEDRSIDGHYYSASAPYSLLWLSVCRKSTP